MKYSSIKNLFMDHITSERFLAWGELNLFMILDNCHATIFLIHHVIHKTAFKQTEQ